MHPSPGWETPGLRLPGSSDEMKHMGRLKAKAWALAKEGIEGASQWVVEGHKHIIVHPGSAGSANNWTINQYIELMDRLCASGHRVLLTGTAQESDLLGFHDRQFPADVINTMGKMKLDQLLALIGVADGLVASSTGPLHMAAASNIMCLGLYGPAAPEWPERWHPLGPKARWLTSKGLTERGALAIELDEVLAEIEEGLKA